jgi:putative nucleotidyltransferase with HDIG domain
LDLSRGRGFSLSLFPKCHVNTAQSRTKAVVVVAFVAAAICLLVVARIELGLDDESLSAAGYFALIGVLAQALAYRLPKAGQGNISFVPFLSAVVVAPTASVVVAVGLAVALVETMQRRDGLKALFNISQYSLAVAAAIIAFHLAGGQRFVAGPAPSMLPLALASAAFFAVNKCSFSAVVAVSSRRPFTEVLWQSTHGVLAYDLFSIPVVYGFAWVYANVGAEYSLIVAVPIFVLRQLYKTNWQLEKANEELLQLMVAAIEARDPYTFGHSQRVAQYSRLVARAIGLSSRLTERVATAALLHDVGKIHEEFAPILRKPGRLTPEEFAVMSTHAGKGAILVAKVTQFEDLVPAVQSHHEAWNGAGYPMRLAGEAIPLWARVIALADTIDAMTTDRPYREALEPDAVRAEILRQAGRQFDPIICESLLAPANWKGMVQAIESNPQPSLGRRYSSGISSGRTSDSIAAIGQN